MPRRSSLNLVRIFTREQRRLAASVQEQHGLILLEKFLADQIDHPGCGASGINWVQQKAFVLRKQTDGSALGYRSKTPHRRRPLIQSSLPYVGIIVQPLYSFTSST